MITKRTMAEVVDAYNDLIADNQTVFLNWPLVKTFKSISLGEGKISELKNIIVEESTKTEESNKTEEVKTPELPTPSPEILILYPKNQRFRPALECELIRYKHRSNPAFTREKYLEIAIKNGIKKNIAAQQWRISPDCIAERFDAVEGKAVVRVDALASSIRALKESLIFAESELIIAKDLSAKILGVEDGS